MVMFEEEAVEDESFHDMFNYAKGWLILLKETAILLQETLLIGN
eukprot:CAMPEP_0201977668 /NCGR_PEP_ID=MMETSP0904-20121228/61374_1 /ASSEMBLY_ACC=CAM_ASM_000553 /TAXON_ID=420261 /ORGANISM="Thalassiosira antarctica, Strain CCMP982" /LENGTH=43 /DNA_ID= /DNA_START= /DNA_END= /DNA_ORIENTATION=